MAGTAFLFVNRQLVTGNLGKAKKFYASRFYHLKIGHGAIGTFFEADRSSKVCGMLVVRKQRAIRPSLQVAEDGEKKAEFRRKFWISSASSGKDDLRKNG